jgi:hypothetical protein
MRQIDELSLWIGTARDARDLKMVLGQGIKAIIDLAVEEPPVQPPRELVYLRFPLVDGDGNPQWLLRNLLTTVEGLILTRVPTLLACAGGVSRSPAIAALAASRFAGIEPVDALKRLREHGPIDVSPTLWQDLLAARTDLNDRQVAAIRNHELTIHNEFN